MFLLTKVHRVYQSVRQSSREVVQQWVVMGFQGTYSTLSHLIHQVWEGQANINPFTVAHFVTAVQKHLCRVFPLIGVFILSSNSESENTSSYPELAHICLKHRGENEDLVNQIKKLDVIYRQIDRQTDRQTGKQTDWLSYDLLYIIKWDTTKYQNLDTIK